MMRLFAIVALLAACSAKRMHGGTAERPIVDDDTCKGVPNVIPNDGRDDRAALQAAIDAAPDGTDLCLPAGTYDFSRPEGRSVRTGYASIDIVHKAAITLRGVGPATRLRMLGDGAHATWALVHVRGGSHHVSIRDLALDGSQRWNTSEQTHLLQLGESTDTTVERVHFDIPKLGRDPRSGGDCIRLLGERGAEVRRVVLRNLTGLACARSFVAVQRGVEDVVIEQSRSKSVGGQSIDFEPSGQGVVRDFRIVDNVLARGPEGRGAYSVALGGGRGQAEDIELSRNVMPDGGLMLINVTGARIANNTITSAAVAKPVLYIIRDVSRIDLVDNTITRVAAAGPGPVAVLRHHHEFAPHDIRMHGGSLIQEAEGNIVRLESIKGFELSNVTLTYKGPSPDEFFAIDAMGVTESIDRIKIVGGAVRGRLKGVARFGQRGSIVNGSIEIEDLKADGPASDLTFARGRPTNVKVRIVRPKSMPAAPAP